jgi:hypothetical protein
MTFEITFENEPTFITFDDTPTEDELRDFMNKETDRDIIEQEFWQETFVPVDKNGKPIYETTGAPAFKIHMITFVYQNIYTGKKYRALYKGNYIMTPYTGKMFKITNSDNSEPNFNINNYINLGIYKFAVSRD